MTYFKIHLFTVQSLANIACAERVYEILNSWIFPPDVFDEDEPIRKSWSNKDEFIKAWSQQGARHFGQVLFRRKKRLGYYADVVFQFGPNRRSDGKPPYHSLSVYRIKESQCTPELRTKLVSLGDRFFRELTMDYGFICLSDEYDAKNIVKDFRHTDGAVEPRKVLGMNWPQCIPGLYWTNYFGKRYLQQGFATNVLNLYPANATAIGDGIRFQTSGEPRFFERVEAETAEREMRKSLGEEWFFNQQNDRKCNSIDVSLEHLRSPRPVS